MSCRYDDLVQHVLELLRVSNVLSRVAHYLRTRMGGSAVAHRPSKLAWQKED